MKKRFLNSTAIVGATVLAGGAVLAAEAPSWKLTGNVNFQFYWADADNQGTKFISDWTPSPGGTWIDIHGLDVFDTEDTSQDHGWYFGVDEAELQLNVSGTADNGLNYGFKIEIQVNTDDGEDGVADEARIQLSGGWGTLQLGDEDGAEDIMNYGGENLMGATGGFDGDQDDYLVRGGGVANNILIGASDFVVNGPFNIAAPSYPTIAGDTSDKTKVSYFSPRFSGFQVGASITPTPNNGDNFKEDGDWENHIGIGANYDNSFGDLRIRASAVYSGASSNDTETEDISAWSVGGIVGWGPFSLGANYTDNSESGMPVAQDAGDPVSLGWESSYWDVGASFETGPLYFSVGYFSSVEELGNLGDSTYEHIALTVDYTMAPGLGVYAEINLISDEMADGLIAEGDGWPLLLTNDTTSLVLGANISF